MKKTTRQQVNKTTRFLAFLFIILFQGSQLMAQGSQPLWMRYNAISPQGDKIAFAYKGDIYVVTTSIQSGLTMVNTSLSQQTEMLTSTSMSFLLMAVSLSVSQQTQHQRFLSLSLPTTL